jgi:cytochrome c oxidase assembly protein subunit 15
MKIAIERFKRFSLLATLVTYFLIFVGGLVRVSGAGLGCPDWPKCFGRWLPPMTAAQLPPEMDPYIFNFALAWIEYINRMIGVIVGLLILVVAFLAVKNFLKNWRISLVSMVALLLTAFQGWLGGAVVASELKPWVVSAHMVVAFIIVSLLVYVTMQAYRLASPPDEAKTAYPAKIKFWLGLLWVLTVVQVLLGTQVREAVETVAAKMPLLSELEMLAEVGAMKYIHLVLGLLVAGTTLVIVRSLLSKKRMPSPLAWQGGWTMAGLVIIQLALGVLMYYVGLPAVMQVLHMWVASLLVGVILVTFSEVSPREARQ